MDNKRYTKQDLENIAKEVEKELADLQVTADEVLSVINKDE